MMSNISDGIPEDSEREEAASSKEGPSFTSSWDLGQPLGFDVGPQSQQDGMSFDFEGLTSPSSSLSLDDFDSDPGPASETDPSPETDRTSESLEERSDIPKSRDTKQRRKKLILLLSALACIGVATAIAVPVYKSIQPKAPPLLGKKSVRHSVAVPELQEELEFLVLATSERDKNLIFMRLGFIFSASNAFDEFSTRATFYRETVYQYLLRARPAKNTQKLWQGILEKQLTDYMKQTFPKSGLQTIRVGHWERM